MTRSGGPRSAVFLSRFGLARLGLGVRAVPFWCPAVSRGCEHDTSISPPFLSETLARCAGLARCVFRRAGFHRVAACPGAAGRTAPVS
ncbi:MAG: hypothetical protein B7Z23_05430, partial [Pseudomonadales bacterium 32-61-5]